MPSRVQSAHKPDCPKCKSNEHVVRFWHGPEKLWACSLHFKVTSTKTTPQTLRERVLHRKPRRDEVALGDVLPNRAARRRK